MVPVQHLDLYQNYGDHGPFGAFRDTQLLGPLNVAMVWNVFLAFVPVVLALILFRHRARRTPVWWGGLALWVLFLPNAPYVLTDVVHLFHDVDHAANQTERYEILAVYAAMFAAGMACYVASLQLFRGYLHRTVAARLVAPLLIAVHTLCVLAIYIGRVVRLNSWDAIVRPGEVVSSVAHVPELHTVLLMGAMFLVLGCSAFIAMEVGRRLLVQLQRIPPTRA